MKNKEKKRKTKGKATCYGLRCMALLTIFCMSSCEKWGQSDPPAGNQVYPKLEQVVNLTFEEELNPEELFAYPDGSKPTLVDDEEHGKVFHAQGGYARMQNPLSKVTVQNAVSLTMWIKWADPAEREENETATPTTTKRAAPAGEQSQACALFSFLNEEGKGLSFTADGKLKYTGNEGSYADNNPEVDELMTAGEWHYLAIAITNTGYFVHVDSTKVIDKTVADFDMAQVVQSIAALPYFYIAYDGPEAQPSEIWVDNLRIYRNTISSKETTMPEIGGGSASISDLVYLNTFDTSNGVQIEGSGSFIELDDPRFGRVFKNATGGMRQNYLKLPSDVLSHSTETKAMTIGVWVNATYAGASGDYMWSPLFTAYGAAPAVDNTNTFPLLALQYRGVVQVNNAGWCDFTDVQNVKGANTLRHDATDWLADREWHYYTATFTETSAKVYFDGVVVNEWEVDGVSDGSVIRGLFSNGVDLSYVCLGGNQAWGWGDPDPGFMFDDFAVYNVELTAEQISVIMDKKSLPVPVYLNTFDGANDDAQIEGDGTFENADDPKFGKIFQNATGGMRQNYLKLPSDVLSHSTETKAMTIGVWVNAANAGASGGYMWSPLFTAYGAAPTGLKNTFPMLALQYRGVVQVNNAGWCDFTDAQNVKGANTLRHDATDWLADHGWHYYTATFTETSAKVYFDGVVVNEWEVDGVSDGSVIRGLFSNGADLSYVCLGGNQAWDWGDADPGFMFDDFAVYNVELTAEQISSIIRIKK
jgi:hypothetical protein